MTHSSLKPQQSIGHQLAKTLGCISMEMDRRQARFGFSRYEWLVVGNLLKAEQDSVTQSAIRQHLGIEESYLTKILDKLIRKKLIKKVICDKDRRQRRLIINPDAENLIKQVADEMISANKKYLQGFSDTEQEQLFTFLERIQENTRSLVHIP